jgi:hypothetical protein
MLVLNPVPHAEFGSDDSFDEEPQTATMLLLRPSVKALNMRNVRSVRQEVPAAPRPMVQAPRGFAKRLLLLSFALATITFMLGVLLAAELLLGR